jgi:hypothetical protein
MTVGKTAAPSNIRAQEAQHSEDVDSHDERRRCFLPGSVRGCRLSLHLYANLRIILPKS